MWLPFFTAAVGSFFGSIGGFLSAMAMARRAERYKTTTDLMNEYLSAEFTVHRDSIFETGRRVSAGDVNIDDIAAGFWYPGRPDFYAGEMRGSLTDLQHLTVYIGYIVRLADSINRRRLDLRTIRSQLGTELMWENDLLGRVADAALRQAEEANAPIPSWPEALKKVHDSVIAPRIGAGGRSA